LLAVLQHATQCSVHGARAAERLGNIRRQHDDADDAAGTKPAGILPADAAAEVILRASPREPRREAPAGAPQPSP